MAELKCLGTCAFFESHETSDAFPVLNFENKKYRTWSHPPKISLSSWVLKMNRSIFAVPSRVAERWTMHLTVLDLGSQVKRVVEISWVNHGLREGIPSCWVFRVSLETMRFQKREGPLSNPVHRLTWRIPIDELDVSSSARSTEHPVTVQKDIDLSQIRI